jgi:hypothetical protein
LGLGHEETTLRASRAYIAGLGTTGVLIGSFFLLLTVGSTLVAFRGVPGVASNGDLSRIELREQRQAAAEREPALLAARTVVGEGREDGTHGAAGDVFGQRASSQGGPAGEIQADSTGQLGPDALRPGPGRPSVGERVPITHGPPSSAPGSGPGVLTSPVAPGSDAEDSSDEGPGGGSDSGSGSDGGSGSGSGSGSSDGGGTDSGSGSGSGSGGSSGSGGDSGSGGGSGTGSGSGSGGGTGTGAGGTVGEVVEGTTGTVGEAVGDVSPGAGETVTETGSAVGGLLGDATSAVGGLGAGD